MNTKVQLFCVWCGPAFLVLYGIAWWGIGQYIPPHPPSLAAADVASFYVENANRIRIGNLLAMVFSTLLVPWFAVISIQMARIEGRFPLLAIMQFGGGLLLMAFFYICAMLWIVAAWRPELSPDLIRMIHEGSWLMFVMVFPEYTLMMLCIAVAGFMDKSAQPVWPRWMCYFNLWNAFAGMGGGFAVFFKTGPFAWNGLIGFYIPVAMFTIWLFLMAWLMRKAILRQAEVEARSGMKGSPLAAAAA